jgi:ribosome-associated heat shock protein Hsp15
MNAPVRLDKWLWAARLFRTRSLAAQEIAAGRVSVNDMPAKASREIRPGNRVTLRRQECAMQLEVLATAAARGPASTARLLYTETASSVAERERQAESRRLAPEPASTIAQGRPTKRERRDLAQWNRWSASNDD